MPPDRDEHVSARRSTSAVSYSREEEERGGGVRV